MRIDNRGGEAAPVIADAPYGASFDSSEPGDHSLTIYPYPYPPPLTLGLVKPEKVIFPKRRLLWTLYHAG